MIAMRFFTPRLFIDLNSEDEDVVGRAEEKWEAARREYQEYFKSIDKKLPASLARFSKMVALHDGQIQERIGTAEEFDNQGEHSRAIVAVKHERAEYSLVYLNLTEPTRLTHPVDSPVFRHDNVIWLYDEVGCVKKGVFSHEILFSNGNVLLVKFRSFRYTERPIVTARLHAVRESTSRGRLATG